MGILRMCLATGICGEAMAKILVADDDRGLNKVVTDWLSNVDHHTVDQAFDGLEAKSFLDSYEYELLVLDYEMPGMTGIKLCESLRSNRIFTPILMLTGKSSVTDKTDGLDAGADDYLTKPFDPDELSARVRALLRRRFAENTNIVIGDLVIDCQSCKVSANGHDLKLQPAEYRVLIFLCANAKQRFTIEAIQERCGQQNKETLSECGIRSSISRIRAKLREANSIVALLKEEQEFFINH